MGKKKPYIVSSWKGIGYLKSRHSGKYSLSKDSKQSADMFQVASPMAKQFRQMFMPLLSFPTNRRMQLTLVGAFKKWLTYKKEATSVSPDDLTYLRHFQFNSYSSLQDRLHVPLQVSWQPSSGLLLQIPAIVPAASIGAPAYTTEVLWKIVAGSCKLTNPVAVDSCTIQLSMPLHHLLIPEQTIALPLVMPENSITVVAIAFEYTKNKDGVVSVSKDKRWLPFGIVGGWVRK